MRTLGLVVSVFILAIGLLAQQEKPPKSRVKKTNPTPAAPAENTQPAPPAPSAQPAPPAKPGAPEAGKESKELHFDISEVPPVVTHQQATVNGRVMRYTATAGRLPIKREDGKIEAEMFFVAYTLEGENPAQRPLTFAFNGGPGSSSVWLHLGALGPRRVVLQPGGFMPAAPYHLQDNQYSLLDKSDLVLVDAIATGWSRAEDEATTKKFLGVQGDLDAFGEFIRLYITRYGRWASPLFLFGESYGTTRAAGLSGYLSDRGISFNGIVLLSTAMDFQTLEFQKNNDVPYILIIPSYTMIAAYHHKLAPDLTQNLAKTRAEVEQWASTTYAQALAKGDAMSPQERQSVIDQMAHYTGLSKEVIDQANLRIDVAQFTHYLLIDQKLRVGRLDGRYTGPDPEGLMDTPFYDPAESALLPPFTAMFNNYVRNDLGYKTDMPYFVFAMGEGLWRQWNWGSAVKGYPDTATALREAMVKDPYLKVVVLEGYYDLATPYYAANYVIDHLNLPAGFRKSISVETYDSGHMVYVNEQALAKLKQDVVRLMDSAMPAGH
ncbi:MAG TPA: peptidase S10 [Terriglobales bacterium]